LGQERNKTKNTWRHLKPDSVRYSQQPGESRPDLWLKPDESGSSRVHCFLNFKGHVVYDRNPGRGLDEVKESLKRLFSRFK
jgi:hypothetical protein